MIIKPEVNFSNTVEAVVRARFAHTLRSAVRIFFAVSVELVCMLNMS